MYAMLTCDCADRGALAHRQFDDAPLFEYWPEATRCTLMGRYCCYHDNLAM